MQPFICRYQTDPLTQNYRTAQTGAFIHFWGVEIKTKSAHVDFGGLGEGADRVDVVVEDDDSDHHPHAEQHGVCVGEPAAILPVRRRLWRSGGGPVTKRDSLNKLAFSHLLN